MSQRDTNLLWLKDMLDHLSACRKQLEWAENPEAVQVITEAMLRELESCRRLCETLQRRTTPGPRIDRSHSPTSLS
jgi:hypothetical protein